MTIDDVMQWYQADALAEILALEAEGKEWECNSELFCYARGERRLYDVLQGAADVFVDVGPDDPMVMIVADGPEDLVRQLRRIAAESEYYLELWAAYDDHVEDFGDMDEKGIIAGYALKALLAYYPPEE